MAPAHSKLIPNGLTNAFANGARPSSYAASLRLLCVVSSNAYEKSAVAFIKYCVDHDLEADACLVEDYLLFLHDPPHNWKCSTLWSTLSHLKVFFKHCVEHPDGKGIGLELAKECPQAERCLKMWQKHELSKMARTFTKAEYETMLSWANDDPSLLLWKTILVFGVHGVLRRAEIHDLKFEDVTISNDGAIFVRIFRKKQVGPKRVSSFAIVGEIAFNVVMAYINCFDQANRKGPLFRRLLPPGGLMNKLRGSNIVVGINTIGNVPRQLALKLGKQPADAKLFTGHSFRRSGATILAESGCSVLQLKEAGGWNSSTVAEHYIAESRHNKLAIAHHMGFFTPVRAPAPAPALVPAPAAVQYTDDHFDSPDSSRASSPSTPIFRGMAGDVMEWPTETPEQALVLRLPARRT